METRRRFIKKTLMAMAVFLFGPHVFAGHIPLRKKTGTIQATVFRAVNGKPDQNMIKTIELMGGIHTIIDSDDIVLIKPNVQWWNQGAPNLSALKTFVDLVMECPGGFNGEVIIAENCHRGPRPWNAIDSGWASVFTRNSDIQEIRNYNELTAHLKQKYASKFSVRHWIDAKRGGRRIFHPEDGPGYIYCDGTGGVPLFEMNNGGQNDDLRKVIMTYPVFKTDNKTMVDFKNGKWENGKYADKKLKFINFSALNHHSYYCGVTSAVKNYLGISDLSGGPDPHKNGKLTDNHYNFHSFPFNKWSPGPISGMIGAEIGYFMNTIRKADLNITTAEWVGLISRTETPVVRTRAVLASRDPVSLDYHSAKYILYPNSGISIHNPDNIGGPFNQYLKKCAEIGDFVFNESHVDIKSYDYNQNRLQNDDELLIKGVTEWGTNLKMLLKYMVFRHAPALFTYM